MNIRLIDLVLTFKKAKEKIDFADFNYFYGQMGAGKSTIARLIDYCLGGDLGESDMTPALQVEFVSASLSLKVLETAVILERNANSNQVRAQWSVDDQQFEVLIPARNAAGEVIPSTGVEVLSDFIFYLSGKTPPKVRRSKIKEDSDLERLSLRDLLWYCYLDQDSMDSTFFHLDVDANTWKRLKSRDVLRFIIGFHQEQVAELESQLERIRTEKMRCGAGANAIREALSSAELASELELFVVKEKLEADLKNAESEILNARNRVRSQRTHAMDALQEEARSITKRIDEYKSATADIREAIARDKAHRNELLALATRFRRSQSAREVLNGVDFNDCPRCGNNLPARSQEVCSVCGQVHSDLPGVGIDELAAEQDLKSRTSELSDLVTMQEDQLRRTERQLRELIDKKALVDAELTRVSVNYDSAYLSTVLESEKNSAALKQQLLDIKKFEVLVQRITELTKRFESLSGDEQRIRSELKVARDRAEKDTQNLSRLKILFLDSLLRAKLPGFFPDDIVEMKSPHFLPEVASAGSGDLAVTSFTNLGSGGKKTLFKCCFAIAVHRLAVEIGAILPSLLIIDSPMKNISERENRAQFEGFFEMLYDLCNSELKGTQFILIDKELCSPPEDFKPTFTNRHMTPENNEYPPLIRYYRGK